MGLSSTHDVAIVIAVFVNDYAVNDFVLFSTCVVVKLLMLLF